MPTHLDIVVTRHCDLDCSFCNLRKGCADHDRELSVAEIELAVQRVAGMGVATVRLLGGEPLLRPDIAEIIQTVRRCQGIRRVELATNGVNIKHHARALTEALPDTIDVMMASVNHRCYSHVMGRRCFQAVVFSLDILWRLGIKQISMVVPLITGVNDDEIEKLARFCAARNMTLKLVPTDVVRHYGKVRHTRSPLEALDEFLQRVGLKEQAGSDNFSSSYSDGFFKIHLVNGDVGSPRYMLTSEGMMLLDGADHETSRHVCMTSYRGGAVSAVKASNNRATQTLHHVASRLREAVA